MGKFQESLPNIFAIEVHPIVDVTTKLHFLGTSKHKLELIIKYKGAILNDSFLVLQNYKSHPVNGTEIMEPKLFTLFCVFNFFNLSNL